VSNGTIFGIDEGCDPILAAGTCADATAANEWAIESIAVPAGASCNARYRASFSTTIADFEDTTTITTVRNFAGSRTIEFDGYVVDPAQMLRSRGPRASGARPGARSASSQGRRRAKTIKIS
jgi:hypothetical protein